MKKCNIIFILIMLMIFSCLLNSLEIDKSDSTSTYDPDSVEFEGYIQTQFDENEFYGSLNLFETGLMIKNTPIVVSCNLFKISWLTGNHKPKYPLNTYTLLLGAPPLVLASAPIKVSDTVMAILSIPVITATAINAITNPQIQFKLDKADHFRIFTSATTDIFYTHDKFRTRSNWNYGISVNFGLKFRLFVSQNILSISEELGNYFIGITIGGKGNGDNWDAWMSI